MPDFIKKQKAKHHRAVSVCRLCFLLSIAVLLVSWVVTSDQMEPNIFRGILLGLRGIGEIMLRHYSAIFAGWYESIPWFPAVVNLLCIAPFVGLLGSLVVFFDLHELVCAPRRPAVPHTRKAPAVEQNSNEQNAATDYIGNFFRPTVSPMDQWSRDKFARFEELHRQLTETTDDFSLTSEFPLVRVQTLGVGAQMDYLIKWEDWGGAHGAVIYYNKSKTHGILLNLIPKEKGGYIPCIYGYAPDGDAQDEESIPLEFDTPLCIYRQGSSSQDIQRYVLTWIGG